MKRLTYSMLFLLLVNTAAVAEPRIGLVLSGGGARGAAHIGVLKVLEELRIPVHAIAGTSMGSLVGGAYAAGVPLDEMERRVTEIDWNEMFDDDPPRREWPPRRKRESETPTWDFTIGHRDGNFNLPKGAIAGQKVQLFLADLVSRAEGVERYDDLPIPFRAVATDLEDGSMRVFDSGPLAEALRASMSVPGLFAPLDRADGIFVDGGLVRNLPVDVIREMGVDRVIAVNLGTSYLKREDLGTIVGVTGQMIAILTEQNVQRSLKEIDPERDLLIRPEMGDITAGDFQRADEAIAVGEKAARAMAAQLAHLSLDETAYAAWRGTRFDGPASAPVVIDEVQVVGLGYVNEKLFDPLKKSQIGEPLDRRKLERDIQVLYGNDDFERITYRVERKDERRVLVINAVEKSWGPGYLSFGINASSDFKGDNRTGLRGIYRQTWVNSLGAQWVISGTFGNLPDLFAEWYQPFDLDHSGFVAPYLDLRREPLSVYENRDRVARYDVTRYHVGADVGTTFGSDAELRLGLRFGGVTFDVDTGSGVLPEGDDNDSGARMNFVYDTLDSAYAPRRGSRLHVNYVRPLEALGADIEYHRLYARWDGARSVGDDTLVAGVRLGSSFGDDMPYYDQFALGGFLKLSGYANEQFRGNRMAYGSLTYYRRIAELQPPLGRGLYLGGSLEYGRLWDVAVGPDGVTPLSPEKDRYGLSLFFGADTWLGPLYLGWGLSGEQTSTVYVQLGEWQ